MMIHEFVERTGYKPSYEEYREIEREYSESPLQKDEFCKKWKTYDTARRLIMQSLALRVKMHSGDADLTNALKEYRNVIGDMLFS